MQELEFPSYRYKNTHRNLVMYLVCIYLSDFVAVHAYFVIPGGGRVVRPPAVAKDCVLHRGRLVVIPVIR